MAEDKTEACHGKSKPATKIKKVFSKNIKSPLKEIKMWNVSYEEKT